MKPKYVCEGIAIAGNVNKCKYCPLKDRVLNPLLVMCSQLEQTGWTEVCRMREVNSHPVAFCLLENVIPSSLSTLYR